MLSFTIMKWSDLKPGDLFSLSLDVNRASIIRYVISCTSTTITYMFSDVNAPLFVTFSTRQLTLLSSDVFILSRNSRP